MCHTFCHIAVTIIGMCQKIFFLIHRRMVFLSCTLVPGLFQLAFQLFHMSFLCSQIQTSFIFVYDKRCLLLTVQLVS